MDIKAYIESGILEAYVLGSLPEQEAQQVQATIAQYPELAKEVSAIEDAMLQYAGGLAQDPPPGMQDKIWDAINVNTISSPATPIARIDGAEQTHKTKVIPLQPEYRKPAQWKYAAAVALLLGSVALNVILWNQGRQSEQANTALNYKLDKLQSDQKQLAQLVDDYHKSTAMMADTAMQTIVMHTMQPGHAMAATLYWSKNKGDAYVAMAALPEPPKGMQYQLWVIQGGKPVSMGMLPNDMANTPGMQKIPMQVTSGEAFAISLEKEGGNPTPTTVYVLGKA